VKVAEVKAWKHQERAFELAPGKPGFALFWEMGLGKTYGAIQLLRRRMNEEKQILRSIIFTPPLVVPQWKEEWLKFTKIPASKITLLQGSQKERVSAFLKGSAEGRIFVTNYEALLMKDLFHAMKLWLPQELIFDECHRLKNPTAQRSKLAYELANPWDQKAKRPLPRPRVLILSGSPILNSPLDIFMQVKVMLGGWPTLHPKYKEHLAARSYFTRMANVSEADLARIKWAGDIFSGQLVDNFFVFRAMYFRDRNAGLPKDRYFPDWRPATVERDGFDAIGELQEILSHISVRATKKESLDLPDEVPVIHRVGLTKEQARVYGQMKKDLVAYVTETQACSASLAIVKALRLMQIASGFVSTEGVGDEADRADIRFPDTPKDEALIELLEEIAPHSKVLVWAVWQENYGQLRKIFEKLGLGYVEAHGQISDAKKREAVEQFKTDPSKRIFLGHPGSGGIGINLVNAPYSIFYSRTHSLEHYLQARARNHRGGQTEKVTHYDLVCHQTIDELVLEKLAQKASMSDTLLQTEKTIGYKELVDGISRQG